MVAAVVALLLFASHFADVAAASAATAAGVFYNYTLNTMRRSLILGNYKCNINALIGMI